MVSAFGHEVSLSQANLIKDDPAYDEESPPGKWFKPSESDDLDETAELPSRLRFFRAYNYIEFDRKGWGRPINAIMYAMYVLVAALVSAANATPDELLGVRAVGITCFFIWWALNLMNSMYFLGSPRQMLSWAGPYKSLMNVILQVGTIVMFYYSFRHIKLMGTMQLEYGLLIVMAASIFVDQRIIDPAFESLYCFYQGAISKEEVKDGVRPITGISNSALLKIAANASKALRFPDEASKKIQQVIGGHRIREGKEEALDDWTYTINKLTHAVSFAPSFCKSNSRISASQCQQLTLQMILYLRVYMDTGKIQQEDITRTAPLTLVEALVAMLRLSFQVPFFYFIGILPRTIAGVLTNAIVPQATGDFINAAAIGNKPEALRALYTFVVLIVAGPLFNVVAGYTEALFTKKMVGLCRRKMLRNSMKGGTKFGEQWRPGKLIDSFSSQLVQFEAYTISFFVSIVPVVLAMISGVVVSARAYPPAVYLFISLVPILFSVDYFEDRANRASAKRAKTDGIFSGKVASAVECRDAIRAADASDWIITDMEENLDMTDKTHFASFFRSSLSEGYISVMAAIYMLLILLPLGLGVVSQSMSIGEFMTVMGASMSMLQPISMFGLFSKLTTQYSGPIQTILGLVDDSLNEESSSRSPGMMTALKKLSSSLSIKNIKFRYGANLPDVIKGVDIGLSPGSYAVLLGESGSGKSTVLSLLMRFQKPSEGTVEWDGTDIYGSSLGSFRENVGVMFQRTMIYQGTIRDNILFGQPDVPGAVEKAARAAEIADVIERLPDKYETVIGGDALAGMSGGQLQRVCMARALYKKPSVLLLDEATSALDAETEHAIIETLVKLRDTEGLTLVSVSHHPSTAVKADKIVVLERGVIAEEGTYEELVSRKGGIFKRMVEAGEEVQE